MLQQLTAMTKGVEHSALHLPEVLPAAPNWAQQCAWCHSQPAARNPAGGPRRCLMWQTVCPAAFLRSIESTTGQHVVPAACANVDPQKLGPDENILQAYKNPITHAL